MDPIYQIRPKTRRQEGPKILKLTLLFHFMIVYANKIYPNPNLADLKKKNISNYFNAYFFVRWEVNITT